MITGLPIGGIRILENKLMVIGPFEDWSDVRSHGRAARRRRQGHRQRIRVYYLPDPKFIQFGNTIVGHPDTVAGLMKRLAEREMTAAVGATTWR